jgi:thiol-disulfide isomerase/thioredoxin
VDGTRRFAFLSVTIGVAVLVGLVGTVGGSAMAQEGSGPAATPNPTSLVGSPAPPLSGRNLTGSGNVNLASYRGKPVVVVFWLNTCPHCRRDLPKLNAYQRKLGKHAQIITAAIKNPTAAGPKGFETLAAAVKTLRLTVPTVAYDANAALNPAPGQWVVAATPTAYIISAQGVITAVLQPDTTGNVTVSEVNTGLAATNCGCALRSGPGVP